MKLFYFDTDFGCGLLAVRNEREAWSQARRDAREESRLQGGNGGSVKWVREATEDDVAWVRAMGGYVPDVAHRSR